jgi:hypothetical protein
MKKYRLFEHALQLRYGPTQHSKLRHYKEVSAQLHTPADLPRGETPVSTE